MYKSLLFAMFSVMVMAQENSPAPKPADSTPQAEATVSAPEPLAQMKGYRLTEEEFDLILRMLPQVNRQTLKPAQKQQIIRQWMMVVAMAQEAENMGIGDDAALARQLDLYRKQLLFERYQRNLIADIKVSEEEARQYFEDNKARFGRPAGVRVSRILVETKDKADEVKKLLAAGTPFEQAAKEHSLDQDTRDKGGEMGWVSRGGREAGFDEVVFALEANQISEPFATEAGWQVVKVLEKRAESGREFSEVARTLPQQLQAQKQREVLEKASRDLFQKYEVKIQGAEK